MASPDHSAASPDHPSAPQAHVPVTPDNPAVPKNQPSTPGHASAPPKNPTPPRPPAHKKKLVPKHPLAIRWMHWINFPVLFVMIWSGLLIYWANDVYKIHLGQTIYFSFFPNSFYKGLNLSRRLAEGMAFHFLFMWIFLINGLAYVGFTIFSGEWRYLFPNRQTFKEAWQVLLHDLHLRKTAPPQGKFNAAQKIAYTGIIVMGLGSVLTGLAIYKPIQFQWLTTIFGGYGNARVLHFVLTLIYCLFFLVHVLQVILAGWNNFQAMVTGFEVLSNTKNKTRD